MVQKNNKNFLNYNFIILLLVSFKFNNFIVKVMVSNTKELEFKFRSYLLKYIKFSFVPCPSNAQIPMYLLCNKTFTNEAMKPSWLKNHLSRINPDKVNKQIEFFSSFKRESCSK